MGSQPTLDPTPTRPPDPDRHRPDDRVELLAHLQTPAAVGGHEFGDWPEAQIANGFGGDLHARHRHDHTRLPNEFTHTHPDLQRDAVRDAEQAFDRLNPDYGVPPTSAATTAAKPSATARPPWPWACGSPSTTHGRTTPTLSSGRPTRTTAWPTPSTPPAASISAPASGPSGSAPNANHHQQHQELRSTS
jgi:hypothetical protein